MALEMIYNDTVDSHVETTPWLSPILYQSSVTSPPPPLWQDFSQFEGSFLQGPPRLIWSRLVRFSTLLLPAPSTTWFTWTSVRETHGHYFSIYWFQFWKEVSRRKGTPMSQAFHIKDPKSHLKNWKASSFLAHLLAPRGINKNGKTKWYGWTLSWEPRSPQHFPDTLERGAIVGIDLQFKITFFTFKRGI